MNFLRMSVVLSAALLAACRTPKPVTPAAPSPPNIVIIVADDLGIGDLGCYNPDAETTTPNLDRLARSGARFTDAHSPSAVCSPTRYGILTGRYCWRSSLKSGVLWTDDPLLIEPDRPTIASELQAAGYHTAFVGKWHLGLGSRKPTDWTGPIDAGPHTIGFDESVGIPSSLDIPPYCWFRDGVGDPPPSTTIEGSEHRRRDGGGFWRAGPIAEGFEHQDVLSKSIDESIRIIDRHAAERPSRPLFLELCLSAPHTPWLPGEPWRGSSGAGHYGDFVNQIDFETGRLVAALDASGLGSNTLLVFTSDNGAHWPLTDVERWGHASNLEWRGQKADIHEAGHRVPFLVRWPGVVDQATIRGETICLTDLYATSLAVAEQDGVRRTANAAVLGGEDSVDLVPMLKTGDARGLEAREGIVHHSLDGMFAIRVGDWKLVEGLGSGGFTAPRRTSPAETGPRVQLYDLAKDPGETTNLAKKNPAEVARLQAILDRVRAAPRSVR